MVGIFGVFDSSSFQMSCFRLDGFTILLFDIVNDVCRFSRDHAVECSERTVLSCLEPVCLCWRRFKRYFSLHLAESELKLEFSPQSDGRSGP